MKNFLVAMMVALVTVTAGISEAEAKRLGGGGSYGRQSQNVTQKAAPATPYQQQAAKPAPGQSPAAAPAPQRSGMWKGLLGGALLGLGLGALLSHLGIGGALASMIGTLLTFALIGGALFLLYRMFVAKKAGNNGGGMPAGVQPAYAGPQDAMQRGSTTPEIGSGLEQKAFQASAPVSTAADPAAVNAGTWSVPADFDTQGFLRHAKTAFIRLQAAWDRADVNDIREFTTPEMYAELKMQLTERGASPNNTDVVQLDAQLLGIETVGEEYVASVKFSGMIKEDPTAQPEFFNEVWNLAKPVNGSGGWALAGIQQMN